MADEYEGRTATSKDGTKRVVYRNGEWVNDPTFAPGGNRTKTTTKDMQLLGELSSRAQAEREARRGYADTRKAVEDFGPAGTGPLTASWLDFITPSEDAGRGQGGFWANAGDVIGDTVGAGVGLFARPFITQRTWDARDRLRTANAKTALANSAQLKGAASDADMALLRTAGVGPYRQKNENLRILDEAEYRSGLGETRALVTSDWVSKHGSIANRSSNGLTYEQALQLAEQRYGKHYASYKAGKGPAPGGPPRRPNPPPSVIGKSPPTITIDLHGNVIR